MLSNAAITPDDRFQNWREWLEGVKREIGDRHVEHEIWRAMTDGLDQHLPESIGFRNHHARLYADAQAMAIRRLVDRSGDVRSLARLIIEIQLHRDVITRARFAALHRADEREASDYFDKHFGSGGDRVADSLLEHDLNELQRLSEPVRRRANKRVAHMAHGKPPPMTFGDIHDALDGITEVFRRYYLLLFQSDLDPVPAIAYDWRRPFRGFLFPEV